MTKEAARMTRASWPGVDALAEELRSIFDGNLGIAAVALTEWDDRYCRPGVDNAFSVGQTFTGDSVSAEAVTITGQGDGSTATAAAVKMVATSGAGCLRVQRTVAAGDVDDHLIDVYEDAGAQSAIAVEYNGTGDAVFLNHTGASGHALSVTGDSEIGSAASDKIGFYGVTAVNQREKANYNNWAAFTDVVDALVALGLFDAS